ncbi:hypothetical protein R1flu_027258 [Riccia fluitans]|uniref:Uncharacterized protein n=1 Tax=Riccia fluitans TaxID=41844 RepID=A0ABD1XIE2_9MARC
MPLLQGEDEPYSIVINKSPDLPGQYVFFSRRRKSSQHSGFCQFELSMESLFTTWFMPGNVEDHKFIHGYFPGI